MAQSTNDAYPTALRLAIIFATELLLAAVDELAFAFKARGELDELLRIEAMTAPGRGPRRV